MAAVAERARATSVPVRRASRRTSTRPAQRKRIANGVVWIAVIAALLAVTAEDHLQVALVLVVDEISGSRLRGAVHAHVEGGVHGVREAPLGPVELHA